MPLNPDVMAAGKQYLAMNGREVFKLAVRGMEESSLAALAKLNLTVSDIDIVVPHQANRRIIEAVADRLKVPMERCFINLDRYGNTSAATIPIALTEAAASGALNPGNLVLLTAFGGGLTWGSAVVRWGRPAKEY
jgi:3-oxoacyl-[acyl-carrier-protein] synthase-3